MLNDPFDDDFVGRDDEIGLFLRWLDDPNPASPWILFVHDVSENEEEQGGVGKSWLLQRCAALARERAQTAVVVIDFFSAAHRNGAEIALQVVEGIRSLYPDWSSQTFDAAFQDYHLALQEGKNVTEVLANALSNIYIALTGDLQRLQTKLVDSKKNLLIFFDTFERIEDNPSVAALSPLHRFPDNYNFSLMRVVIAGRNAPSWKHPNWQGRKQEVQLVPLRPFSIPEMVKFINERVYLPEELKPDSLQAQALHKRTLGRPIMLGLVTDVIKYGGLDLPRLLSTGSLNFEEYLVSRINGLDKPVNWVVLFMSHIYHRFNPDILAWVLDKAIGVQPEFESIAIDQKDLWARLLDLCH